MASWRMAKLLDVAVAIMQRVSHWLRRLGDGALNDEALSRAVKVLCAYLCQSSHCAKRGDLPVKGNF